MAGKISQLTPRAVAALGAATTALEVTTDLTTVPASGYVTLATLSQWLMANITTNIAVNTNKFQVTAATGNVGVGGAATADIALYMRSAALTGVTQYGFGADPTFNGATTSAYVHWARMHTAAAAFTMVAGYTYYAGPPSLGAASAITTNYGFYAANQGAAGVTHAYGLYIAAQSGAATTNIGLYNAGTTSLNGLITASFAAGGNYVAIFQNTTAATPYNVWIKDAAGPTGGYPLFNISNSGATATYFRVDSLTGGVGIGTVPFAYAGLYVLPTLMTGTQQYGVVSLPTASSAATTDGTAFYGRVATAAAAFTMASGYAFYAVAPSLGAGSAITSVYGFYAANQGGAGRTNAYGVYIAAQSGAATTNIGLYNAGTTRFDGIIAIGSATSSDTVLYVRGLSSLSGTTNWGTYSDISFLSSVTVLGTAVAGHISTAAAAFTMADAQTFRAAPPTIGAGSAVTNMYGYYVGNMGAAGVTNAYGVYIAAQSGAATTNIGLYNLGTSRFDGCVGIGVAPSADVALYVRATTGLSTTVQYGVLSDPSFTSAATTSAASIFARMRTAVAAYTMANGASVWVASPTLGAGSAITTQDGIYVANQGGAGVTNAYGIYIEAQSGAATTNIGLYNAGTTRLNGLIGVNANPDAGTALYLNQTAMTGATQFGIYCAAQFSSAATTYGIGVYTKVSTAAAAFTMLNGYATYIDVPSLGAGSAITTQYGINVQNQGKTGIANAYGIFITTPTVSTVNWALAIDGGQVYFRNSALATGATTGHLFIPTSAGAPTGVPASIPTGQVALQYDSTNNKLYVYNGAWKSTAALT